MHPLSRGSPDYSSYELVYRRTHVSSCLNNLESVKIRPYDASYESVAYIIKLITIVNYDARIMICNAAVTVLTNYDVVTFIVQAPVGDAIKAIRQ